MMFLLLKEVPFLAPAVINKVKLQLKVIEESKPPGLRAQDISLTVNRK